MFGMPVSIRQLCENDARDFLGDETWKRWKAMYDECMSFRKNLKGKPTEEERLQLQINADWIRFCDTALWHSARQAEYGRCSCASCDKIRKEKAVNKKTF